MSAEERRELVVFITERVMGLTRRPETAQRALLPGEYDIVFENRILLHTSRVFDPITNDADAMAVLKVCAEKRTREWDQYRPDATLVISSPRPEWNNKWIIMSDAEGTITAASDTFPEAIGLFARKLHGG